MKTAKYLISIRQYQRRRGRSLTEKQRRGQEPLASVLSRELKGWKYIRHKTNLNVNFNVQFTR